MGRVDCDGIFCAIRGVARSLQLRKSVVASSSIHQRELVPVYDTTPSIDDHVQLQLQLQCSAISGRVVAAS
jgi:hypothetical protein